MRYTIANVDDREASRYYRTHLLRGAGYDIVEAESGSDAIRAILEHRPQVVLLDVRLPDIDGLEVCRLIKENPETAGVQVLHVSAIAVSEPLQAMALESGADGYLVEPVDPAVLLGTIRALIRQWQTQADLRLARARLEHERARTRFARLAAKYGVWEWDIATGELQWSAELRELLGCDPARSMTFSSGIDLVHPVDRVRVETEMRRAAEARAPFRVQYRMSRDGEIRWLESIGDITPGAGTPTTMTGIVIDITERKRAEDALERERERMDVAFGSGGIGTFVWEVESGRIVWDARMERIYGIEPGAFEGSLEAWSKRAHPDDVARTLESLRQAMRRHSRDAVLEYRILRNGEIRWLAGAGRFYYDETGKPVRMVGFNQDVTDRKRIEERLQQSEERFRMATQAASEAIWEWNAEAGFVAWSDTYAKLYGRPEDAASSMDWWLAHIHPEDRERVTASFRGALIGTAGSWECELRFRKVDQSWAQVYDRALIARAGDGRAVRVVGAMLDVTELNIARQHLRVLKGLLPICSACKKIRDTNGSWHILEAYIYDHSEAHFSHGMCPDCATQWYGSDPVEMP